MGKSFVKVSFLLKKLLLILFRVDLTKFFYIHFELLWKLPKFSLGTYMFAKITWNQLKWNTEAVFTKDFSSKSKFVSRFSSMNKSGPCLSLSYSDSTKKWAANHNVDNLMGFTILHISRLKLIAIVAITFMKNYLIQIQIVIIVIKWMSNLFLLRFLWISGDDQWFLRKITFRWQLEIPHWISFDTAKIIEHSWRLETPIKQSSFVKMPTNWIFVRAISKTLENNMVSFNSMITFEHFLHFYQARSMAKKFFHFSTQNHMFLFTNLRTRALMRRTRTRNLSKM